MSGSAARVSLDLRQHREKTEIRPARLADAEDMAETQNAIFRSGLWEIPVNAELVRERYLDTEYSIACTVADQESEVVGFQSLMQA